MCLITVSIFQQLHATHLIHTPHTISTYLLYGLDLATYHTVAQVLYVIYKKLKASLAEMTLFSLQRKSHPRVKSKIMVTIIFPFSLLPYQHRPQLLLSVLHQLKLGTAEKSNVAHTAKDRLNILTFVTMRKNTAYVQGTYSHNPDRENTNFYFLVRIMHEMHKICTLLSVLQSLCIDSHVIFAMS